MPASYEPMPPLITLGVTVRSLTLHVSTDGTSAILFSARAKFASISQFELSTPEYFTAWL